MIWAAVITIHENAATRTKRDTQVWQVTQHGDPAHEEYDPINLKLQYLWRQNEILYQSTRNKGQRCQLSNTILAHICQLADKHPSEAAAILLHRNNIFATKAGQALPVSPCAEVLPNAVQWNHKINNTCFNDLPIRIADHWIFASPYTKVIKLTCNQIDCHSRPSPVYNKQGKWTDGEHEIHLQQLHQEFAPITYEHQIEFTAWPFFNTEIDKVAKEI